MFTIRNILVCSRQTSKVNPLEIFNSCRGYVPKFHGVLSTQSQVLSRHLTTGAESDMKQIYYGSLTPKMKAVKVFSLTTSIVGIAAQPLLIEQGSKIGGTPMVIFMCGFVGLFTFVTPFLLHFITRQYVTELLYSEKTKEYEANTISFFLMKKRLKFKLEDVVVPEVPGMFSTFLVKKTSLFVDPALFPDPNHYVKIMGFDKPLDFKLNLEEDVPKDSKNKS